jgi:hypothetical protein
MIRTAVADPMNDLPRSLRYFFWSKRAVSSPVPLRYKLSILRYAVAGPCFDTSAKWAALGEGASIQAFYAPIDDLQVAVVSFVVRTPPIHLASRARCIVVQIVAGRAAYKMFACQLFMRNCYRSLAAQIRRLCRI